MCLKSLQKFQSAINEMASKFVTNDDDLENIEIEPVAPPMETEGGEKRNEPPRGKTNNVVSEQVRHKPACTATGDG